MANATDPLLYGLDLDHHNGVMDIGSGLLVIKQDCRRNSRLSRTQTPRRVTEDNTLQVEDQYERIRPDTHTVVVFSVGRDVPTPRGFRQLDCILLRENVHTRFSLSNSKEYCFVFARDNDTLQFVRQNLGSFLLELHQITQNTPPRSVNGDFLRWVISRPSACLQQPITENQALIVGYNHQRLFGEGSDPNAVYLINVNGSLPFMTNGRNPNGKIQSMSGPAILSRQAVYKLGVEGMYRFRDIPLPPRPVQSRRLVCHTVHPDFIRMVLRHFL